MYLCCCCFNISIKSHFNMFGSAAGGFMKCLSFSESKCYKYWERKRCVCVCICFFSTNKTFSQNPKPLRIWKKIFSHGQFHIWFCVLVGFCPDSNSDIQKRAESSSDSKVGICGFQSWSLKLHFKACVVVFHSCWNNECGLPNMLYNHSS